MRRHVGSFSLLTITFGILAVWLAAPSAVLGQTGTTSAYWDSASGTGVLWGTSTDWSPNSTGIGGTGVVPIATTDVYFNGSSDFGNTIVQFGAAGTAKGLFFNNSGTTLLEDSTLGTNALTIGIDGITLASTAGAVTLGSTTPANLMPISITGSQIWTNNSATSALNVISAISDSTASTLTINGAGSTNISGIISNPTGTLGLTMLGSGTLTLSALNTYTGITTVSGGTLALTPAGATPVINSAANSSALVLGGGSLAMTGAAGVNAFQQFPSTTINVGGSSVSATDGSGGGNFDVILGAITRNAGGTVSFTLPAGSPVLGTNGISTTTLNNGAGILGGYATVGGNWAVSGGPTAGTYNISALSVYTPLTASGGGTPTTTNLSLATALSLNASSPITANSLNITDTTSGDTLALGANTLTFNGASGGLLYSGGSSYVINGSGFIGSGTGNEFIVTTTGSGNLTISAPLVSATTGSVTKAGTGTLTLTGANTFTGALALDSGTLVATTSTKALGAGTLSLGGGVLDLAIGSQLNSAPNTTVTSNSQITSDQATSGSAGANYTFGTLAIGAQTLTIAGGANVSSGTAGVTFGAVTASNAATFTVNNPANGGVTLLTLASIVPTALDTITFNGSGNTTVTGVLGGTTAPVTMAGTGTLTLTGANTYTGATSVTSGTLALVNASVTGQYRPLAATLITVSPGATLAALAGSGAINFGSSVQVTRLTLDSGSIFNMVDGLTGAANFASSATALTLQGATLNFDFGLPGTDTIKVTNAASVSGTNTINLTTFGSIVPVYGVSNLITAKSGLNTPGTFQFANATQTENLTVGGTMYTATLSNSATAEAVTIVQQGNTLTWTGEVNNVQAETWNTGNSMNVNWANSSNTAVTYSEGSNVAFTDNDAVAGGFVNNSTITIQPGGVTPAAVSFNSSLVGYIITDQSGPIQGNSTTLTVNGPSGVVIRNFNNTYGGGTWISGSTGNPDVGIEIGSTLTNFTSSTVAVVNGVSVITQGPLGTGTVTLSGGALEDNNTTVTLANNIVISANTSLFSESTGTLIFDGRTLTNPATVTLLNNPVLDIGSITMIYDPVTGVGQKLTVTASSNHADLYLYGANTYSGITTINDSGAAANTGMPGLLSVSSLAVEGSGGGVASGVGQSSNAAANLVLSPGILQYVGSGDTTDRLFTIGLGIVSGVESDGGTLDSSGTSGPIVWSNSGAIVITTAALPLTLTGSNTGANILAPILSGTSPLNKSGGGTWFLAGANTTTGNTTITGGTLGVTATTYGTGKLYANSGSNSSSVITVGQSIVNSVTVSGTLEVDRWDIGGLAGDSYGAGGGSFGNLAGNNSQLMINGGTIMYTGNTNNSTPNVDDRGFTIGTLGATLDAAEATSGQIWYVNLATSGTNTIASTSGTLTLNGPGNGVLAGAIPTGTTGGLTMSGGNWTLTAANLYTGATALNAGTLIMGNANALFTSPVTLTTANNGLQFAAGLASPKLGSLAGPGNIVLQDNAGSPAAIALTVGGNNSSTNYSGSLSGPGSLTMNSTTGAGVFTLSGANTYTGTTTVTKGTLALASTTSSLGNTASLLGNTAISVTSGATFAPQPGIGTITAGSGSNVTGVAGATLSLPSGAFFSMKDSAVGTFQLQQESSFSPTTPTLTLGGATLTFDLNGSVATNFLLPAVDLLAAGGTASVSGINTINLNLINSSVLNPGGPINLITASSGLNPGGTPFQFSGGGTTLNMTVNTVPYVLSLNTTPTALTLTIVSNGPTLNWTGEGGTGPSGSPANTAPWDTVSTNNWSTNPPPSPVAATFATGDTVNFNDNDAIAVAQVTNNNIMIQSTVSPTAVNFNNSNINYTLLGGAIVGPATLTKLGTGLLSIQNQSNLYARGTTLIAGMLQISSSTTTGGGAVTSGPLGTGTLTLSSPTVGQPGGTLDIGNSNTVTLANSVAITANSTLSSSGGGTLVFDGTSLTTPATVVLSNNPTLTVNNTTTINDVISGSGQALTLAGSGTLILGGANTYSGITTISSGTLQLGNGTINGNGSVAGSITDDNALTFLTAGTPSYATAISGTGSVTVNGTGSGSLTLSGGNSFQGGLTILGGSNLTLSGANTYSGGTLIQNGTLRAGAVNTLPATGSVTFGGTGPTAGTLDLNGYNLAVGGLFIAPAAASTSANQIITNTNASGNGSTATLTYNGGMSSNSFAGTLQNGSVSNLLALTVASGNLTLSGANTYTGATAVTGGTLQVASPGSLASAVTVGSTATLSGSGAIGGLVTVNNGGILAPSGVVSAATPMTLGGGLTLNNGAVLDFNLDIPGSGDSVNVTGGALSLGTTGGILNINEFGGGGELQATSYPLIFDTSITGNAAMWTVVDHAGDTGHTYSFTDTGGQFDLVVTTLSGNATWTSNGPNGNYNLGSNWSTGITPNGVGLVATFGSGSQSSVTINSGFTIGQLNFNNGGNSSAPTSYNLTGNGSLTLNNSGSGASVNVSSGGLTPQLGSSLTLTLADSSLTTTFNIASGSSLNVGGPIGQSSSGQGIILAGGGTLELATANTYSGPTTINSGTLQINSGGSIASTSSISIAAGGTLQLAGTSGALPSTVNIATHGTGSAGDGALVLSGPATETVGTISGDTNQISDVNSELVTVYSGNTTVGDGNDAASLTATQILQNTLTINAGSTVTIAPSGSGIPTDAVAATSSVATSDSTASDDTGSDPFTAIQAAIASGSISSAKGKQLENRIAAIERLAATDPGLDVSLLEDRVLAALPSTSVWSSSGTESSSVLLLDSGSGLLAVDSGTSGSSLGSSLGGSAAFAPAADFGGSPAAVPEPSSLLLAMMAGIGILIAVRRRTIYCES